MKRKRVHVGVYEGWADWEAGLALAHLGSGDWQRDGVSYEVVTVGSSLAPVRTKAGLSLKPDIAVRRLDPSQSAMLILPGADSWMVGANQEFVTAAGLFLNSGVPVAAICGATLGLAAAGLLNDRDHTSNSSEMLQCTAYTGRDRYRDELAVVDRGLITASGVAPVEFARAIFTSLDFYEPEVSASWYRLYGEQDLGSFSDLMRASGNGR